MRYALPFGTFLAVGAFIAMLFGEAILSWYLGYYPTFGGGIIAGNSLILLLAWRADSLTGDLLVSSVITSVIMAAVGVLACAAPARRALRVQPNDALRQG